MADRRVWVEYSPSMMEPVRPGAVSPDRALCLPTFSHFVTVNKTSLSLSLSPSQSCVLQTGAEQVGQVYEKSWSSNVYRSTQKKVTQIRLLLFPSTGGPFCCLLQQDLIQSCPRGERGIVEDMCYEIRRAEAYMLGIVCASRTSEHGGWDP